MSTFFKAAAMTLAGLVLWICLNKHNKDMSLLLTLTVTVGVLIITLTIFDPILDFIRKLKSIGNLDNDLFQVILKTVGIGLLSEMCHNICKDAGNASMGKLLQITAAVTILWLSLPVFERMLSLLEEILGTI